MRFPRWLTGVLIGLMVIGVVFRFVNLNHKVYSREEVDTTVRAAGYTFAEIDQTLFQNQAIAATALQTYQQIKPESNGIDTVRSLLQEEPRQSPLYFFMTRGWMEALGIPLKGLFKSSLTVTRSLPALLSLLALPAMYGLAWELFAAHPIALLATTLMAVSPSDILLAQTARQYSLLSVLVLASSFLLLRAIRQFQTIASQSATAQRHAIRQPKTWLNWGLYALSLAIGLLTHPLFVLSLISHMVYVGLCFAWDTQFKKHRHSILQFFSGAIGIGILVFSPWLVVMLLKWQAVPIDRNGLEVGEDTINPWLVSMTSPWIDFGFASQNPWINGLQFLVLILLGLSLYSLCRRTPPTQWWFVLVSIAVPLILLARPTFIHANSYPEILRYRLFFQPGLQLAVAYFLATNLSMKRLYSGRSRLLTRNYSANSLYADPHTIWQTWLVRAILAYLIAISLTSITLSALSYTWWDKGSSGFIYQAADSLNRKTSPLLISEQGKDNTNTIHLISFSYRLKDSSELLLVQSPSFIDTPDFASNLQGKTVFVLSPSTSLQGVLEQRYGQLTPLLKGEQVWEINTSTHLAN